MDADPWAGRSVQPQPTPMAWGPWLQAQNADGTFVAVVLHTFLGELVLHWQPDALERFCEQGIRQARMAKLGILPAPGFPDDGQGPNL
jgi:hypothetical protein